MTKSLPSKSPLPQVLIVARDENIASLMESLVDCAGYRAVHPAADERPAAALTRIRPAILLLDCDHPVVMSDALHETARVAGIRVVLFSAAHRPWELDRFAQRRGLRAVALPANPATIGKTLDEAMR